MGHSTQDTGKLGEDIATSYLKKKGYAIITRNYTCPYGEADIIARDKDEIVFVEVKSKRVRDFGDPMEAVDLKKQRTLSKVALCYLNEKDLDDCNARFDVVSIYFSYKEPSVELIENAFELAF
jgi:putative endonuclease